MKKAPTLVKAFPEKSFPCFYVITREAMKLTSRTTPREKPTATIPIT
jgi:hypothetical protein